MSQFQLGFHLIHFFLHYFLLLDCFSFSVLSFANLRSNNPSGGPADFARSSGGPAGGSTGGGPADFGGPADSPAAAAGELSTAETSFTSACESSMASSASVRAARPLPARLAPPQLPLAFAFAGILDYQLKTK
jgi:hypothetical protein